MPRKKPAPENAPQRTTISLPYYIGVSSNRFEASHRELALKGFSDLVSRALGEYIEKHHPGLIAQVEAELRGTYQQSLPKNLRAAEAVSSASSVEALIASEVKRRKEAEDRAAAKPKGTGRTAHR